MSTPDGAAGRADAIRAAVAGVAEALLRLGWSPSGAQEALARLGPAAGADRVAVLEAGPVQVLHEWTAGPAEAGRAPAHASWPALGRGEPAVAAAAADLPVVARGRLWGTLSLDRAEGRQWSAAEVEALGAAAAILGAAIAREQADEALRCREEELLHARRRDALRRLAGGVAHDFNNVLAAIMGYGELLREGLGEGPHRADVDEILEAATRGQSLTGQLVAFSRTGPAGRGPLDLNGTVRALAPVLERLLDRQVVLVTQLEPHLHRVDADVGQIELVLLDLTENARDAMLQTGGTLTIRTRNTRAREADEGERPTVELVVSDTGRGMDAETRAHAFEPFFSTKAATSAAGLGLATVRDLVEQNDGSVALESTPAHGTTVTIRLPAAAPETPRAV